MSKRSLATFSLLALTTLGLGACSGDDGDTATDPSTSQAPAADGPSCDYQENGMAAKEVELPPAQASVSGDVDITISTSAGDVKATLDADATPCTVNSFVSLADQGYFDGTTCHRLTTQGIYVLQCGDPTGSGAGGPGYSFADELSGEETYPAGTLAMANAGPDTNGSQFFIVYDDTQLPAAYTVFGTVDSDGIATVQGIAAKGTRDGGPDGAPKEPVDIESVVVS